MKSMKGNIVKTRRYLSKATYTAVCVPYGTYQHHIRMHVFVVSENSFSVTIDDETTGRHCHNTRHIERLITQKEAQVRGGEADDHLQDIKLIFHLSIEFVQQTK